MGTLKTTKFSFTTRDQVVTVTGLDNNESTDVLVGSGSVYSITLVNNDPAAMAYFRAVDASAATVGTTTAEIMIRVAPNTENTWTVVDGLAFTNLTVWGTDANADSTATAADDMDLKMVMR